MFTDEGPMPGFDEPDEFDFPPMDIEPEEVDSHLMKRSLRMRMNGPCSTSCTTHHERNHCGDNGSSTRTRCTARRSRFCPCRGRGSRVGLDIAEALRALA